MEDDERVPLVKGIQDWLHRWVPEVQSAGVGFQRDAVAVQHVLGVGDLGQRALDAGQRRPGWTWNSAPTC